MIAVELQYLTLQQVERWTRLQTNKTFFALFGTKFFQFIEQSPYKTFWRHSQIWKIVSKMVKTLKTSKMHKVILRWMASNWFRACHKLANSKVKPSVFRSRITLARKPTITPIFFRMIWTRSELTQLRLSTKRKLAIFCFNEANNTRRHWILWKHEKCIFHHSIHLKMSPKLQNQKFSWYTHCIHQTD